MLVILHVYDRGAVFHVVMRAEADFNSRDAICAVSVLVIALAAASSEPLDGIRCG